MRYDTISRFSLVLALAAAMTASPALAQGKSKGHDKNKSRPELVRRDGGQEARLREASRLREESRRRDRRDDDRYDDRYEDDRNEDGRRRGVPPGWCKGKGNPHNTVENCGYPSRGDDDRYESRDRRDGDWSDRDRGSSGSYERSHDDFHRQHDRQCRMRAAERPLDIRWQLQVRADCNERHDDWHYRAGQRHS